MASASGTSVETALESLQPIRDLAKNWDIDIAACLEEYLQDLLGDLTEEERRNLPQQAEKLNFSQAALLLQNSSSVYSRKVEYLYKLVLKVHEELIANAGNKSSSGGNKNTRKSAVDAEIEDFNAFDPHQDFLLLDDVLPVDEKGNKINLQEKDDDLGMARDNGTSFATAATATRLSLGVTLAGGSQIDRSAASQAANHNFVCGSLDTGSLRLIDDRCQVGDNGMLILPGAGGTSQRQNRPSSMFGSFSPRTSIGGEHQDQGPVNFDLGYDNGGDFGGFDDDDNDNGGFVFADDNDVQHTDPADTKENIAEFQSTQKQATSSDPTKGTRKEAKEDPWALLDPHSQEATSSSLRPLRIGRTCKLPPTVDALPSQCVTGARTKRRRQTGLIVPLKRRQSRQKEDSLAVTSFKAKLSAERKVNPEDEAVMPTMPLSGLVYGDEFLYIARAILKQKRAIEKEQRKRAMSTNEVVDDPAQNYGNDEVDDGYGYGPDDFGGGDDDHGFGDDDDDGALGNSGPADDMFLRGSENEDNYGREGKTFEELCRAHIQAFAKGAAAYATETRLSKRVGDWHDRLAPILEEEENRPEFDIHEYTKRVVTAIQENNVSSTDSVGSETAIVDFEAVTRNCPKFEVCRLFLASLSLSNSGNVLLQHGESASQLRIELLDGVIERPMETYLAPSMMS